MSEKSTGMVRKDGVHISTGNFVESGERYHKRTMEEVEDGHVESILEMKMTPEARDRYDALIEPDIENTYGKDIEPVPLEEYRNS